MNLLQSDIAMLLSAWAEVDEGGIDELASLLQPMTKIEPKLVGQALSVVEGTILEPFKLTPNNLEAASVLVAACLSKSLKRFRISGDDSLSAGGGAVMLRSLRTYLVHQDPTKSPRNAPSAAWFSPAQAKRHRSSVRRSGDVLQNLGKDGLTITIPLPSRFELDSAVSALVTSGTSLSRINVYTTVDGHNIELRSGSPEGILRMTTACNNCEMVEVKASHSWGNLRTLLRLAPVSSTDPVVLESYISEDPHSSANWIDLKNYGKSSRVGLLAPDRRRMLAKDFVVPSAWDRYLEDFFEA